MNEHSIALIERMIAGDEAAFDEVYRSYSEKLYRMAFFITGNKSDSEDILQDTFVQCFLHRQELKMADRFEPWIFQILTRRAWRTQKKKKGKQEVSFEAILDHENPGFAERILEDTKSNSVLGVLLAAEERQQIARAIAGLDIRYRTVLLLYYFNDMSMKEIAQTTRTLEGTVKSRLHKARNLLKKELLKQQDEKSGRSICHG